MSPCMIIAVHLWSRLALLSNMVRTYSVAALATGDRQGEISRSVQSRRSRPAEVAVIYFRQRLPQLQERRQPKKRKLTYVRKVLKQRRAIGHASMTSL
ncbi:unnamed protein product [Urochloa humidicola]